MERNRDGRRGNVGPVNGISRRRPRSASLRDSPEEDGAAEMMESGRFRDRGSKKERDRDRSSRSKRRRGDRREEGEESTDESIDEEEDDGDESGSAVRPPPLPPPPFSQSSSPAMVALPASHNPRKIFPSKIMRPPTVWKAADEMIGVSVPRKARSASAKRPHECLPPSGEQSNRQPASSSPPMSAPHPSSTSPSSSTATLRKKTKQISGSKNRPPKISKSSASIQEIEIEVAEVLYGLTRQFQEPSKPDNPKSESREENGSCQETKSRASSPARLSPPRAPSQSSILPVVPKRKRPRQVKCEDESLTSASVSSASKTTEGERTKADIPSPKSERTASSPAENGGAPPSAAARAAAEEYRPEDTSVASNVNQPATDLEASVHSKDPVSVGFDANPVSADDHPREKFQIDLMAPPPGKPSADLESEAAVEEPKTEEGIRYERAVKQEARELRREERIQEKITSEEKPVIKEAALLDVPPDPDKSDRVRLGGNKQLGQRPQLSKAARPDSKPERSAVQAGSVPLPMSMAGWPGGVPFGYMGQVPSLQPIFPMDGGAAPGKALQPHFVPQQLRPKRCATHCYIAQNIYYQQLARMNPFWPAKPYNLNMVPGADPGRLQDRPAGPMLGSMPSQPFKDKNGQVDPAQRKQLLLQQPLQASAAGSILPAPAFIFPVNQPQGGAAAASGTNRAAEGNLGNTSAATSGSGSLTAAPPGPIGFNYANLQQGEAQYLLLQNHGYPFPVPAHVGAAAAAYRGASHAQALPFFNGSLYASQILHPSQLHQQQQQQPPPPQQGHQNASTSTGSSSSQKLSVKADAAEASVQKQPQRPLPPQHQTRQMEGEAGGGESPSSVDSRISQKGNLFGHNFVMALHPQNFALMSAPVPLGGAAHSDKSQQQQQQQPVTPQQQQQQQGMKVELSPSQAFAMSFASFNGAAAAAAAAAAANSGQPHGLDFSSSAQNHAIFQSLPEAARHGYQVPSQAPPPAQHKKPLHQLPDGAKALADSMSTGKASSRDVSSARVLNMGPGSVNGSNRPLPNRPDAGASAAAATGPSSAGAAHQQRQQHLLHLQKQQQQQQQQLQMHQQQLASRAAKAGGAVMSKLPNALAGIPPALMQGNSSAGQPAHWKNSPARSAAAAAHMPNSPVAVKSNHHLPQQSQLRPAAQSQISFGISSARASPTGGPAPSAAAPSPTSPAAKAMGGSPRASPTGPKMSAQSGPGPLPPQPAQSKSASAAAAHPRSAKSQPPSILGQPHLAAASPGSAGKSQQKQPPFPQPQIFFANSYQQQQQPPQPGGALALCPPALMLAGGGGGAASSTSDNSTKGSNGGAKVGPTAAQFASAAASFPYFHGVSAVPVKPAEQKPAAGS
ncbi:time for coffee isoform X2 [Wolffia australiana]